MKMKCARRRHQKKAAIPKGLSPIGRQCEPMGLDRIARLQQLVGDGKCNGVPRPGRDLATVLVPVQNVYIGHFRPPNRR